ncbi:MAG: hypothetical protein GXY34_08925 [Syntrophomonadaceae bacterium]|nr:hypothetical protein [Syntrophomonadaceae bacterium]
MKKENMFFLIMVLMAAVIAGATMGIVSSFDVIVDRINVMNSEVELHNKALAEAEEADTAATEKAPAENQAQAVAVSGASTGSINYSTTSDIMVVTAEEKAQITEMLHQLGMPQGGDYNQFIKDFQQRQNLPATGSLDSCTLRVIINKTTEQKARQQ